MSQLSKSLITIYDTTLRDGQQGSGVYFSVEGKLEAVKLLDSIGIPYIEGGWPGSNEIDTIFFQKVKDIPLKAKLAAFGSTRRAGIPVEEDVTIKNLLQAQTPVCTLVGKSSLFQVQSVLRTTDKENLQMIADSIQYLRKHKVKNQPLEVGFDAEHFFDGFKYDPKYALRILRTTIESGASWITLCDTNGGTMMDDIEKIVHSVIKELKTKITIGIHAHDDCGLAVANSLVALKAGVRQIQGTINGYGERAGNANLLTIIANLKLKMGINCLPATSLKQLTQLSRTFIWLTNCPANPNLPYVGENAFKHRAGLHADGVRKIPSAYEHVNPDLVGNERHFAISIIGGTASIEARIEKLHLPIKPDRTLAKQVLERVKTMEAKGFQFESAPASFDILVRRLLPDYQPPFKLSIKNSANQKTPQATLMFCNKTKIEQEPLCPSTEDIEDIVGKYQSLLKALQRRYPYLAEIVLESYRSQHINEQYERVFVELSNGRQKWTTVCVHENIHQASWLAIADALEYALIYSSS